MSQPLQKMAKSNLERSFIKPSSSVCKSLFDSSNPLETKQMMETMLISESNRMKELWDFDCRLKNLPENLALKSANAEKPPMALNRQRFEWTLQDKEKVPYFYTRPYCFQKSEPKQLDKHQSPSSKSSFQSKKLLLPLSNRDQNKRPRKREISKRNSSRRVPHFTSPPKITSGDLNPSLVRFVTALRVPFSSDPQQNSPNPESPPDRDISPLSCGTIAIPANKCEETAKDCNSTVTSSSVTSRTNTSRQLFAPQPTKKGLARETFNTQPKITDVIPQRKHRTNTTKRRRLSNEVQASTSTSH